MIPGKFFSRPRSSQAAADRKHSIYRIFQRLMPRPPGTERASNGCGHIEVARGKRMQMRRFWFATIGITVMLAVLFAVALALVTATGALAFGKKYVDQPESGKTQIF